MAEVLTLKRYEIERVYPDDPRVPPQTLAHHIARYKFAAKIQIPIGESLDVCCES